MMIGGVFSPACLMLVRFGGWLVLLSRAAASKDAELVVVRHEVAVLRRAQPRPRLDWAGRAARTALIRLVPSDLPMCRLVTPRRRARVAPPPGHPEAD